MTIEHRLTHPAATDCLCGALLYEESDGRIICEASGKHLRWVEIRHSKQCIHVDDLTWVCVDQCRVRRAQLSLLEA